MAAAAILAFFNFKLLTVGRLKRVDMRLLVKFGRNRDRGGDTAMRFLDFSKMAAIRHL